MLHTNLKASLVRISHKLAKKTTELIFFSFSGKGFIDEKAFIDTLSKHWKPVNTEADVIDAFKVRLKGQHSYTRASLQNPTYLP